MFLHSAAGREPTIIVFSEDLADPAVSSPLVLIIYLYFTIFRLNIEALFSLIQNTVKDLKNTK